MLTYQNWLKNAPIARLEARMLLEKVSKLSHAQLITQGNERLPEKYLPELTQLLKRRQSGEPMAYIMQERAFYGRMFAVTPAVLIPRPETEHLLESVLNTLKNQESACVWDMGCGSGILAISIQLARKNDIVWASDISQDALAVAQKNAQKLGASIHFTQGDWFHCSRLPEKHSCDVIVSNPPYIEADDIHLQQGDLRFEPLNALTDFADGLSAIRTIAQFSGNYLKNQGSLWLEHGYNQAQAVHDILKDAGFIAIQTQQDYAGLDRITGGIWQQK